MCHHCGLQGHTKPNCHKLRALNNARDQRLRGPRDDKRNWTVGQPRSQNEDSGVMNVMKILILFLSVFKIQKPIKIEKSSKSLIVCLCVYHM